jgi:acyl-lipid omega-6 desaturase (Delta-12 desaturase)
MNIRTPKPDWYERIRGYRAASWSAAIRQVAGTLGADLLIWGVMIWSLTRGLPLWISVLGLIPASFLHVRLFILFHDCCHGSLFPNRRPNVVVGHLLGAITFTPFEPWRRSHLKHHATNAQLDHRGTGDVWTMTVREYHESPPAVQFRYRVFRNPFVMFVIGPIYLFVMKYRFFPKNAQAKEKKSTIITNLLLAAILSGGSVITGVAPFLLMQLSVIVLSGMMGVWLFYVQHQFDPGYWARDSDWNEVDAAIHGSSYYNMPRVFQWLFGNIGIHHIHHLLPRIPNYRLHACYRENPEVQVTKPLTLRRSLASLRMNLWDEPGRMFLSFRQYRRLHKGA